MKFNYKYLLVLLVVALAAFWFGRLGTKTETFVSPKTEQQQNVQTNEPTETQAEQTADVPQKVIDVLNYVKAHGEAPEGYVGGRIFQNREHRLPETTTYNEWDVNPKVNGQNRGAERLITGKDHSAYFTNDHYRTFKKIE
jgi:ribonuclease T1